MKLKNRMSLICAFRLQKVFPDAVPEGSDGYLVIRKEDVFCAMINSIKQVDKIVQGLVNDVKAIMIKVQKIDDKKLQKRLAKLEQKVTH